MNATEFVRESNRIEGIGRAPTTAEVAEHMRFTTLDHVTVGDLVRFVSVYQPDARLRNEPGMNVRVGPHIPPAGGTHILVELLKILEAANSAAAAAALSPWILEPAVSPFALHCRYETLHPFMDGNGRSGRVLWAWQMNKQFGGYPLGFLHHFYYQALQGQRP